MRIHLTVLVASLLCAGNVNAQFPLSSSTWATPQGGNITNNTLLGYNAISGLALSSQTTGSQTWSLLDMNGDNKPDLVVTGSVSSNNNIEFDATGNPYWKVYLNSGSGFASSFTNWSTPQGGNITNNRLLGYNNITGLAASGQTNDSQTWSLADMNGDNKPDLVVMGSWSSNNNTQFNASTSPNWNVFLNTGSGFAATATNWSTPQGGNITNNTLLGYNSISGLAGSGQTNGSETWSLADMNGDNKPDLLVTGALTANSNTEFNATSNPNWKVFLNTGTGFAGSATTWSTPQGGNITNNTLLGYNNVAGLATTSQSNGSETWTLVDMNGDNKPDLIVTGSLTSNNNTEFNATGNPNWKLFINNGSGFSGSATIWSTPQGGNVTNNTLLGYNNITGLAAGGQSNSSETWSLVDLNGDNKPDLVVEGSLTSNNNTEFNATNNPYWKFYSNTGSGFSGSAINWLTPQGGNITNNTLLGYNAVGGLAASGQTNSSETWSVVDMNGDNNPDLVVTGAWSSNNNTQFDATGNPYWKVFLNGAPSSVKDNTREVSVLLYPNPISDILRIYVDENETIEIILYNVFSQQILQQTFTNSTTINTEQMQDGIYFYELRNDKGTLKTGKLVKQ